MTSETIVDTSVAVPTLLRAHESHGDCVRFVRANRPALAGHASVETYSVITRLPIEQRIGPVDAARAMATNFPRVAWPSLEQSQHFLSRCAANGIVGGAVYDALVASAALSTGAILVSLDRRALPTYRAMGVEVAAPKDFL